MSLARELLDKLRAYKVPLIIWLEDGAIVAKSFSFDGPSDISVVFHHPEGDIVVGTNFPTRAESYGISAKDLEMAEYASLVKVVQEQTGADCQNIDECPWVNPEAEGMSECFDDDGVFLRENSELRKALASWLDEADEDGAADNDAWCSELSEGLVGYAIREALPQDEVTRLGLRELDFGSPGGYAPRVAYKGAPSTLQDALRKFNLPFLLE